MAKRERSIATSAAAAALLLALAGDGSAQPAATSTMVGSSASAVVPNQPVTFSAFVSGGATAPSGTVTFSSNRDGALGPSTLDVFAANGRALAAGTAHTCALTATGGIKCWGHNWYGQLGNGSGGFGVNSNVPVDVSGLGSGAAAVGAGDLHTCALTAGGGVKCWGQGGSGRLGDGLETTSNVPVNVSGLGSGVVAVAVGFEHSCALTASGGVKCWGTNGNGQLGNGGSGLYRSAPVDVVGLGSGIVAIAAGDFHSCALTAAGGVKCWGSNNYGQLGDGNGGTFAASNVPVNVSGLGSGIVALAAVESHTCALTTAGGVQCWGRNDYGQLGDGTNTQRNTPVDVSGLGSGGVAIAGGGNHSCALTAAGGAKCWGYNFVGELGNGSSGNSSNVPVNVSSLAGATAIAGGGNHTCALTAAGGVKCWGYNSDGQLGDGTNTQRNAPVDVPGFAALGIAKASLSTSALSIGAHTITASYAGDGSHSGSAGSVVQVVRGAPHDTDSGGKSDIVWRDTSGTTAVWLMDGAAVTGSGSLGDVSTAWQIVGQRDFDGDGKADLLWRTDAGDIALWFLNGTTVSSKVPVGNVPPAWSIVGTGDLDGDGKADLLWRDTSGNTAVWLMNGAAVTASGVLGNVPTNWSIVGHADFDADGKTDILWRDTASGDTAIWFMNGATVASSSFVATVGGTWNIVATGDFNADGKADILWRDASGNTAIWLMDGASVIGSGSLGAIAGGWTVAQTGDFNGDGKADILWRNTTSGDTAIWFMNGTAAAGSASVANVPTTWVIQSVNAN